MALDKTFAIYTGLMQKKYSKDQKSLEQYDIRSKDVNVEFEIRFKDINKIKFEDIHKKLLVSGFILQKEEYYLKISNYINDVRCEISDLTNIKNFCKTNILPDSTKYLIKEKFKEYSEMIDNNDYNFRISIQKEISLKETESRVTQLLKAWASSDKSYRYMNRVTLIHPTMPGIVIDLSVVKSAKKQERLLKEREFGMSKLFDSPEGYEIEIELVPDEAIQSKAVLTKMIEDLKKTIKYICSGIQSSNFPISFREQHALAYEYYSLFNKESKVDIDRFAPISNMFIGPSSYTLQKINMVDDPGNTAPCILRDFCVTDKADGDRKMLFIAGNSKIYFITSNMNIQYTGARCKDPDLLGLLLDGEHILYDKKKKYINLYAAFDIYFMAGRNVRLLPFISDTSAYRYKLLQEKIAKLNETIEYETKERLKIDSKRFAVSTEENSIQACCEYLFDIMATYPYNTDGLIFTSKTLGVGIEEISDKKLKNYKYTWKHSFKWKPPEFNTIDFLVKNKKTFGNKDEIKNIFSSETQSVEQFKILNLYVGWDESMHGYSNPQEMLFRGDTPTLHSERKGLTPQLFVPSSPYDENAHICYLPLKNDTNSTGIQNLFTEEGESIESDTIVEFKYEFNENVFMRWKPLRVRYDKTSEYKNTNSIFGNAFHVANSNWQTIHNPITKEMLVDRELKLTMDDIDDKDVYYNKATGPSKTVNLRDFHNIYVKKLLIDTVAGPNKTLIDFAVGKAGDLQKWIHARIEFVLGIDISKDNIHNKKDGACARYIGVKQKNKQIPNALFIQGDSSKMILNSLKSDEPLVDEPEEDKKSKFVLNQILGIDKANEKYGKYVSKQFGVANKMFDVGSIQFAIHYMFENKFTLHNFLKNVSDFVKPGGYFIGTCYDGAKIFQMLEDIDENDSKDIFVGSKKIWSVIKKYDNTEFRETLGLKIGVYQETINKVFDEYLVDFKYLIELLEQYGFRLSSPIETVKPLGDFGSLYKKMRTTDSKITMTEEESQISFLNNYFIFRKFQNVDTEKIHQFHTQDKEVPTQSIGIPVRLNKKIVLKDK
jgi:SAM-dependent methyltransferase